MNYVEIYFADLTERKQRELLKTFQIDSPEAMNWDILPLASIHEFDIEEEANEREGQEE